MTTTLQFPDLTQLASFTSSLQEKYFELNVTERTITCFCTEDDLKEATIFYGARVLQQHGALQNSNSKQ